MSRIEEALLKYGVPRTAARAALREAVTNMIADGPGTTAGIHDVGVFYVGAQTERFVLRNNEVYRVPARTVVKLRPRKASAVKLDESPDVRIDITQAYPVNTFHLWKSVSRAGNFVLQQPAGRAGEVWKLYRHAFNGYQTYVFGHDTLTIAEMQAIDAPLWDDFDDLQGFRCEHSLTSLWRSADDFGYSLFRPNYQAEIDSGTLTDTDDATNGREAVAHVRSRALTF